ncbi:hypothetical protein SUGI_0838730 [Cryptomeria japonica]|nr:hypothetical protein SUGI_0838730 [Cryptomeria japonica]
MSDKNRRPSCEVEDQWMYEVEDGWIFTMNEEKFSKDNSAAADKHTNLSCDVEDGWMYVVDGGVNKTPTVVEESQVGRIKEETNLDSISIMKI